MIGQSPVLFLAAALVLVGSACGSPVVAASVPATARPGPTARLSQSPPDASPGLQRGAALSGHLGDVLAIAFSPDGRLLASGSRDGTARIWESAGGQEVRALRHRVVVSSVAFSPDGRVLASGAADGTIGLWEPTSGRELATLSAGQTVSSLAFSPDGRLLAAAAGVGSVRLWEVAGGREVDSVELALDGSSWRSTGRASPSRPTAGRLPPVGQTAQSGSGTPRVGASRAHWVPGGRFGESPSRRTGVCSRRVRATVW